MIKPKYSMARKVKFSLSDITFSGEIIKVNREKIYGWSEVEVYDKHSSKCELGGLVDGQYIIPYWIFFFSYFE